MRFIAERRSGRALAARAAVLLAPVLAAPILLAPALAAPAPARFNGAWRITMVTEAGACDATYNYAITIQDGSVRHIPEPGDRPLDVSGGVAPDGAVALDIRKSIARVDARGRLEGTRGAGTWRLGLLGCQGRWTARRQATA